MSRPPFALTDDQARRMVLASAALREQFPVDRHDHRPFVAGFLRVVHQVCGRTFSPSIYRRLLAAYAPDRSPSTTTLAIEKKLLEEKLARERPSDEPVSPQMAVCDAAGFALVSAAVRQVMDDYTPLLEQLAAARAPEQQDAHFAYLVARLADSESANASAQAGAARLSAQLQEALGAASIYREQLAEAQGALTRQAAAVAKMADELADMRKFTLMAIEGARGETRDMKEVCRQLQTDLDRRDHELDTLRRQGYRQAVAASPPPPAGTAR